MALDVIFARIVEQHCTISKFVLIGSDAEGVWCQHKRRLTLIPMELMNGLAPIFAASDVALVFGDHERNAVHQQDRIFSALLNPLDSVLVCGSKVIEVLPGGIKRDEIHSLCVFA